MSARAVRTQQQLRRLWKRLQPLEVMPKMYTSPH
jgi:hypothetical protein